jgi:hypothetical protein
MFKRAFFDSFDELRDHYLRTSGCQTFTLTIRAFGQEFDVEKFVRMDEYVITFTFYDNRKSLEFTPTAQERTGAITAWPAVSVPFEAIESVEFNPGKAKGDPKVGFRSENDQTMKA